MAYDHLPSELRFGIAASHILNGGRFYQVGVRSPTYPEGPRIQIIGSLYRGYRGTDKDIWGLSRGRKPKYYDINGIWALKPYYFGPWTLRAKVGGSAGLRRFVYG